MATYIHFRGGGEVLVSEDHEDVVKAIAAAGDTFVTFSRRAAYSDPGSVEGKPVHVRPDSVTFVTPA